MFTYSHANTPLGQSERAYYLSYFIILVVIIIIIMLSQQKFGYGIVFAQAHTMKGFLDIYKDNTALSNSLTD